MHSSATSNATRSRIFSVLLAGLGLFFTMWLMVCGWPLSVLFESTGDPAWWLFLKGAAVVGVVALSYCVSLRYRVHDNSKARRGWSYLWKWVFGLMVPIIVVVAIRVSIHEQEQIQWVRMRALVDSKARQLAVWLNSRFADARLWQKSELLREQLHRWQSDPSAAVGAGLRTELTNWGLHKRFSAVRLFDFDGHIAWSITSSGRKVADIPVLSPPAGAEETVAMVGPYVDSHGKQFIDFVVPVSFGTGPKLLLYLQVELQRALRFALDDWPGPTHTGEILLFHGDSDRLVYLSALKHGQSVDTITSAAMSDPQLLAAKVARKTDAGDHLLEGLDYRGLPAIGTGRRVPGTDWYLLTQLDRSELHTLAAPQATWRALGGSLALFIALVTATVRRQGKELTAVEARSQVQAMRLRELDLLAAIADSSDDAIFAVDRNNKYIFVNPAACRYVGKSAEDILGNDDTALFPPEQAQQVMNKYRTVIEDNKVEVTEEWLTTTSGNRVFHCTSAPLRRADGEIVGMVGVARDSTERKRAENDLKLWAKSFELSHLNLALSRPGSNRLVAVNPAFAMARGYSTEELAGASLLSLFPADRHQQTLAALSAIDQQGRGVLESEHICKDGRRFPVVLDITVLGSEEGKPYRRVMYAMDISERRQSEQQLRLWAESFEKSGLNLAIIDPCNETFVSVNPAFARTHGYDPADLAGASVGCVIAPETQAERRARTETLNFESHAVFESLHVNAEGLRIPVMLDITVLRDEAGTPCRHLVCATDISERKDAERALRRQAQELRIRNDELERFNRAMVGRELAMIELKKQINALAQQLNQPLPHKLNTMTDTAGRNNNIDGANAA